MSIKDDRRSQSTRETTPWIGARWYGRQCAKTGLPREPLPDFCSEQTEQFLAGYDEVVRAVLQERHPTLRDVWVFEGRVANVSWADWSAELVRLGGDRYGPGGVIEQCGEESWRVFYDDGYSPQDALDEDASYGG